VELSAAFVGFEVRFVFFAEKGALMMIKPPGQTRIAGIFEVNDGIFIPVEPNIEKQLAGTMCESLVHEFAIFADGVSIKVAEDSGRS
jgi:hypothetical protein